VVVVFVVDVHDEFPVTATDAAPVDPPRSNVIVFDPVKHVLCLISKTSAFVLDALIVVAEELAGSPACLVSPDGMLSV
jgi:hypothetical protein